MEFKVFKNENSKILKEYWLTQSEWDALDKTTVQEGDIYHIVGTIDKGDLSADVNASLAKGDSSLQKPTATLAKESFVKVGIDGTQKFDESSYAALDTGKTNVFNSDNTFNQPVKFVKDTSYVEYGEQSSYKFRDNSKENAIATLNDLIEDDEKTYITFKGINFPGNDAFDVDKGAVIDWGDGTIQTITGDPYEQVSHTYSEENLYRIVISNLRNISTGAFSGCLGLIDFKLGSTVIDIGGAAFQNTGISSITIPKTITQMELMVIFADCTKLKTVRVLSTTPLTIQPGIFENSPIEKIIVPKSAINAYKSATGWSTYADKIVYEVDSSDLADNTLPKPINDTTGSTGQVLKKTANGSEWGDIDVVHHHYIRLTCTTGTLYYDFLSNESTAYTTDTLPAMDDSSMISMVALINGLYSVIGGVVYRGSDNVLKIVAHGIYATSATEFSYLNITGETATVAEDIVK